MSEKHHITRISGARTTLQTALDSLQIAVETDNAEDLVYKDNGGVYHITAAQKAGSVAGNNTFGNVTVDDLTITTGNTITVTGLATNQILFGGNAGVITQDIQCRWDNANKRFGAGPGVEDPKATIHALSTTEQLRLGYDGSSYVSFTVDSNSNLTMATAESGKFIISDYLGYGATPETPIDIFVASAGTVTPIAGSALKIENSTHVYAQFLVPDSDNSGIYFGSPSANNKGYLLQEGNSLTLKCNNSGGYLYLKSSASTLTLDMDGGIYTTAYVSVGGTLGSYSGYNFQVNGNGYKSWFHQASVTGAVEPVVIEQKDVDVAFVHYKGASGVGQNLVSGAGSKTIQGYKAVYITDATAEGLAAGIYYTPLYQ